MIIVHIVAYFKYFHSMNVSIKQGNKKQKFNPNFHVFPINPNCTKIHIQTMQCVIKTNYQVNDQTNLENP